jgi:hypothetical protein
MVSMHGEHELQNITPIETWQALGDGPTKVSMCEQPKP